MQKCDSWKKKKKAMEHIITETTEEIWIQIIKFENYC